MTGYFQAALAALLLASPSWAGARKAYNLRDCVNIALEKSPAILTAKQTIEERRGGIISARAVLYPKAEATGQIGLRQEGLDQMREDWRVELEITREIFSGGKSRREIEIADLKKDIAYIDLEHSVNETVWEVKNAFYRVLLLEKQVLTQQSVLKLLEQELSRQKSLFDAGRTTKFNVVRTEVRMANQKPALIAAENGLLVARIGLADAMGIEWANANESIPFNVSGEFDCPPVDLTVDQLLKLAMSQRPDFSRFSKQIEIENRHIQNARVHNVPTFDLFARGISHRDTGEGNSGFTDQRATTSFGLMGTWNIFDGFFGRGLEKEALARKSKLEIGRYDTFRQIEFEIRRAHIKLQEAHETAASQSGNVEKAHEALRLARSVVESGRGSQFDILQATVDLNQSQGLEIQARFNYHQALADIERAVFARGSSVLGPKGFVQTQPIRGRLSLEEENGGGGG